MTTLLQNFKFKYFLFGAAIVCCIFPVFSPAGALTCGFIFSFLKRTPDKVKNGNLQKQILQLSIILLGFGMPLSDVLAASREGVALTIFSVTTTMLTGIFLGYLFKVDRITTLLISSGTAICGGSAIAAVAPIVNARNEQLTYSLGVVFTLNGIALYLFPAIGHWFGLSAETFGYWAAMAIHDTSSVVGAGAAYGEKALRIATTVKLTRALWIIPLTLILSVFQPKGEKKTIKFPWFIVVFAMAILMRQFIPAWEHEFNHLHWIGTRGLLVALLLIGANISINEIRKAGSKVFLTGFLLWLIISISSLTLLTH